MLDKPRVGIVVCEFFISGVWRDVCVIKQLVFSGDLVVIE